MPFIILILSAVLSTTVHAQMPTDPEAWYRDNYAPLWADSPGKNVDAILAYYASKVRTHEAEGAITVADRDSWLREPMKEWLAEGWLKAEMQKLTIDRLNPTTAAFKASWLDHYAGGETEVSCGWYLADMIDGRWRFTAYADIDCAAHDL